MSRYVVTELEGWEPRPHVEQRRTRPGLSVHVLDTAWNHRVVGTYRSENKGGFVNSTREERYEAVRAQAAALAARLNRQDELCRVLSRGG